MEKFIIGLYGNFSFTIVKKIKKQVIKTGFTLMATITDIDDGNIELTDNDGLQYIISKKNVRSFEPGVKPDKL